MKIQVLMFFLSIMLTQNLALATENSTTTLLKNIQKSYENFHGLKITYKREVITRSMSMLGSQVRGDQASGYIYIKKPEFLRLEQTAPEQETIVANADLMWWYIPGKKTVYKYPSGEFGRELRLLIDIFSGLVKVEERFRVSVKGTKMPDTKEIELIPTPPWQEIDRVFIEATGAGIIQEVSINNNLGSVTKFIIENVVPEDSLDKDFFEFKIPEHTEIITENENQ